MFQESKISVSREIVSCKNVNMMANYADIQNCARYVTVCAARKAFVRMAYVLIVLNSCMYQI